VGNPAWNPRWFVAAASDDENWTVEAAIPLAELTPHSPRRREVWAVAVERIVPSREAAPPLAPASPQPGRLGLLLFE
jgi:hypothetical protein